MGVKIDAQGERTDLVLHERLAITVETERATEAMVLTEWKRADDASTATRKAGEAIEQAALYASGALAATELRTMRYIVLVSPERIPMPSDVERDGVIYRHINVAVNPAVASIQARRGPRGRSGTKAARA